MRFESCLRFDTHESEVLRIIDAGWRAIKERLPGKHHRNHETTGSQLGINDVIYKPPSDPPWREAWRVTEGEIAQMNREVKAHGAAFLAVTLSTGIQVWPDPTVRDQYMERLGVKDLWYPDLRISALGEHNGFPVLVLAQPMQAYAENHHVFLHGFKNTKPGEGHWNEAGHRLGGELIAARLCQMIASGQVPAVMKETVSGNAAAR